MKNYRLRVLGAALSAVLVFSGCSASQPSSSTDSSAQNSSTQSDETEVRKIYAAVGATFEPYCYIDENNEPAGYDVAVLKEIDARLPEYEFVIENMELSNILISLDTKKVDIGSQQFEYNPERAEKYLFTTEGFANYDKRIVYKEGRTDISSIDDLAGKRVSASQGSNTAAILEEYNESHDGKVEIVYSNGATSEMIYDDVMNGRLDAIIATRKTANRYNEAFDGGYEINEDGLFSESEAYFLLAQGEEQLRDAIDRVLKEMKEDGTLTALSVEYTGSDYNSEY